ncbi:MAG: VWA domain-containing protein [Pyrinomonadaceae bacterium]|nr:VWA domain-containing protein [Pyrinomonadaceae bacterium]MCX7640574.1 VWA domain-containing protein [Pyrinomonadaceae bacterium]MDW8303845.1 VWA domain-containing protein [Acidobacteriota bacterium]
MKAIFLTLLLLCPISVAIFDQRSYKPVATLAFSPTPPPEDEEPIRIETELVNVFFTAQDSNRRFVTTLTKDDIKVFENGEEQEIFTFASQADSPLSIAILIDTSLSQLRTLPDEKEAAKTFVESIVRPEKDEVSILSFTGETTLEQDLTNNIQRLRRAIDRIRIVPPSGTVNGVIIGGTPPISGRNQRLAGSTALWDAIWVTIDEVLKRSPEKTRRTIILLTDGYDTSSRKKMDDAIKMAMLHEVTIYSIGIGDYFYGGVKESYLKKLSQSTGGKAFFPKNENQLRSAFAEIEKEIRSQYLVAYQPKNQKKDGSFRKIEVRLVNPELVKQQIKITHREGYFAKTDSKQ